MFGLIATKAIAEKLVGIILWHLLFESNLKILILPLQKNVLSWRFFRRKISIIFLFPGKPMNCQRFLIRKILKVHSRYSVDFPRLSLKDMLADYLVSTAHRSLSSCRYYGTVNITVNPTEPPQSEHPDQLESEVFFLFLALSRTSKGV